VPALRFSSVENPARETSTIARTDVKTEVIEETEAVMESTGRIEMIENDLTVEVIEEVNVVIGPTKSGNQRRRKNMNSTLSQTSDSSTSTTTSFTGQS